MTATNESREHPLARAFTGAITATVTIPVTITVDVALDDPGEINEFTESNARHVLRAKALQEIHRRIDSLGAHPTRVVESTLHDTCPGFTYIRLEGREFDAPYTPRSGDEICVMFDPNESGLNGVIGTVYGLHLDETPPSVVVRLPCGVTVNGKITQEARFLPTPLNFIKPLEAPCQ